jgi:branched-subunit amino acid transport protein
MTVLEAMSVVLVIGAITYASRAGLILFLADRPLPPPMLRALRNVGPAVLSALTVTLVAGGNGIEGIGGEEVVGLAVAGVVAAMRRNLIASLIAGMVALWAIILIV